jgi:hypothetical protein
LGQNNNAVKKQSIEGGNVYITVDGKQVVNLGLEGTGGVNEIPIYSNSTGWHQIEVNDDIKNACANALNCTFIDLTGKFNESTTLNILRLMEFTLAMKDTNS